MTIKRIIFAGTPDFAVPCLQGLIDSDYEVVAVYTQPDRRAGRGRHLTASPVKQLALDRGLPVLQPDNLKSAKHQQQFRDFNADIMVVVAYGLLLPKAILDIPPLGCINVHASLLPKWRGAAPIQRAIQAGDHHSGITIMQMDVGLDTGDILAQQQCDISSDETGGSLHDKLMVIGARILLTTLTEIANKTITPIKQDNALTSYAKKISKQEAVIDWNFSAKEIENKIRAFNPCPVAFCHYQDKALRIWQAKAEDCEHHEHPGKVIVADKHELHIACGKDVLKILQCQLPGGRRMDIQDFLNAHNIKVKDSLSSGL